MPATNCINGALIKGDTVLSTKDDDYCYLVGKVTRIAKLGSPEHESGNLTDDVFVDFLAYPYAETRTNEIEEYLSRLYTREVKLDEAGLDEVIMAPEALVRIPTHEHELINALLSSAERAEATCHRAKQGRPLFTEKEKEFLTNMENNETHSLPSMKIAVYPIEPKGNLLGFASVTFNDAVTINDVRILQGENGLFAAMPSKPDQNAKSGYRNIAYISPDFKDAFNEAVIGAYHNEVKEIQTKAAKLGAQEKPSIAEQFKSAAKEAKAQSADKETKTKSTKARAERE